jgi:hypothetical protein
MAFVDHIICAKNLQAQRFCFTRREERNVSTLKKNRGMLLIYMLDRERERFSFACK